jgi:hypothetical protein
MLTLQQVVPSHETRPPDIINRRAALFEAVSADAAAST